MRRFSDYKNRGEIHIENTPEGPLKDPERKREELISIA
jgi:hypothetical protein